MISYARCRTMTIKSFAERNPDHLASEARISAAGTAVDQQRDRGIILVVDDDAVIRSLARLHLENAGYEVMEAKDAIEGGYAVLETAPDLIICDINMPYMSGYEFVQALKADPVTRGIAVILLSSTADVAEHGARLGAVACLKKPLFADKLVEVVELFAARQRIGT